MRRRYAVVGRLRRHIPRDSRRARAFEPLASMLTTNRGAARPTWRYIRHNGLTVKAGPFRGLAYPRSAAAGVPGIVTRLAGTYEIELGPAIEELIAAAPPLVVNVGAGEGYYAVGIARRCPGTRVLAYEADPYQARMLTEVARLNAVGERVEIRGTCDVTELARIEPPPQTALLCDCEGCEAELIDPQRITWLRQSALLVEVHESFHPGLMTTLRQRLAGTHELESIEHRKRYLEDHPVLFATPNLSAIELESLISELRPWRTPWLWAKPKLPAKRAKG